MVEIQTRMLKGSVVVPPSKSAAHRAIISAALTRGKCTVKNIQMSNDIVATCGCLEQLGAVFEYNEKKGTLKVNAQGLFKNMDELDPELDCGESGSTLRFLIPIALLSGRKVRFIGHGRLMQRPQKPYFDMFDEKGVVYQQEWDSISAYGELKAGTYVMPGDISSQFITGLLFALSCLKEDSEIIITKPLQSRGYVDMTISVMRDFGVEVVNEDYKRFFIKGGQKYKPQTYTVEADYSQAAFFLVAGALGCDIECIGLREDSIQGDKAILDIIKQVGGKIEKTERGVRAVRSGVMRGITVDVREIPDLVPILAVLFTFCEGESKIINADRLRMKESDSLKAIATELNHLGAKITEGGNYLRIDGVQVLCGNTVSSWNDHRIAMALAIAACRAEWEVRITGAREAVKKSYPDFFEVYDRL